MDVRIDSGFKCGEMLTISHTAVPTLYRYEERGHAWPLAGFMPKPLRLLQLIRDTKIQLAANRLDKSLTIKSVVVKGNLRGVQLFPWVKAN